MYDDDFGVDPWVIPIKSPSTTSADAGEVPPLLGITGPGAEQPLMPIAGISETPPFTIPTYAVDDEELPTEGFHPRLRHTA